MKRCMIALFCMVLCISCAQGFNEAVDKKGEKKMKETSMENPFFTEWDTPFGVPPFDKINESHYVPAFEKGMAEQIMKIEKMVKSDTLPTFENTIEVLENSDSLLTKVSNVFYNQSSADTNKTIQDIEKKMAPILSKHNDDIMMNEGLFSRVKSVYDRKESLTLTTEQVMVLKEYYKDFIRGGANLNAEDKEKLREINKELSLLSVKFGENILNENNWFELYIDDKKDLAGLPPSVIQGASEAAEKKDQKGRWLFTLHKPSLIPFLQYADNRPLREKMFKAYIERGNNNNEKDNKDILSAIVKARIQKANLLGYETHAQFILEENMAKKSESVYRLLNQLWEPAIMMAKKEAQTFQSMIDKDTENFKLEPWDWWYYAEKVRVEQYALDENMLRPYFELKNVRKGAFDVATKLFGITFEKRNDIPVYHKDVEAFEVKEKDGTHIGILMTDYFPRESKQGGAWMSAYRSQYKENGKMITPVIVNVGNFSKPVGNKPSLLSLSETLTLFHEFGHGLHGLLSNCTYKKVSGTSVPRDFVELPSQLMENWALEPNVMKMYAKHYETGEAIPDALIEKIKKSNQFNQGFATVEYLAASYLDMDWHTLRDYSAEDVLSFESRSLKKIGLIPEIISRSRSSYFQHIFSWGYSAGYYSYIWAQVLDADAFEAFKEKGLFDQTTADALRKYIYSAGGTGDPMSMYIKFRGAEPKVDALLKRKGFLPENANASATK